MTNRNQSEGDVEITLADGSVLALMLDPEADPTWKPGTPYSLTSALAAATNPEQVAPRLTTRTQSSFKRGIGLDYNAAYGVWTRDGYAMPAGAVGQPAPAAIGGTGPIVAFAEYAGNLWVAQQGDATAGGIVYTFGNGTGVPVVSFGPLPAGDLIRDLLVADNGSGLTVLYATSESATHTNARLHRYDGTGWVSTVIGREFAATRGLGRMAYEFMQPDPSVPGDWRILALTGPKTFAYTLPNANPMGTTATAGAGTANWTVDVKVGTQGQLLEIASAKRHFWFGATDNLYDVDEAANSSSMTSYTRAMQQQGNGVAVLYWHGYIYMSLGRGLIRVRVDGGPTLDEVPGQCAPGWGTPAENEVRGYVTAMCPDQGGILAAVYNPTASAGPGLTGKSYICWGVPRDIVGIDSPNPLIWHGPEVVIDADYKVTRMWTSGLDAASGMRLWIASISFGGTARLDWVYLPIAGSPLQDLVSVGPMRFAPANLGGQIVQPYVRLELLRDDWGDGGASNKILYSDTIVTRGLSKQVEQDGTVTDDHALTTMQVYSRADPKPGSTTWPVSTQITTSPRQDIIPSGVVQGHWTQLRIDFISPQGPASPSKVGVLDAVRRLGWVEVPSVRAVSIPVRYGDGVTINPQMDPDDVTAMLKTATESTKLTLRDRWGKRWTVKLDQVMSVVEEVRGGVWGKTVHTRLQGSYLAGPLGPTES